MTKKELASGAAPERPQTERGDVGPAERGTAAPVLAAGPLSGPRGVGEGVPDPLEPFNTRLPRSLQRRLKVHAALHGVKIQDVLSAALSEYLSARGS